MRLGPREAVELTLFVAIGSGVIYLATAYMQETTMQHISDPNLSTTISQGFENIYNAGSQLTQIPSIVVAVVIIMLFIALLGYFVGRGE